MDVAWTCRAMAYDASICRCSRWRRSRCCCCCCCCCCDSFWRCPRFEGVVDDDDNNEGERGDDDDDGVIAKQDCNSGNVKSSTYPEWAVCPSHKIRKRATFSFCRSIGNSALAVLPPLFPSPPSPRRNCCCRASPSRITIIPSSSSCSCRSRHRHPPSQLGANIQ